MTAQLFCGDALAIMADMEAASVDLVVTDPPFRTISGGSNVGANDGRPTGMLAKNDGKIFQHNNIKSADYLAECYRVLKPGRDAYFMTNNLNLSSMLNDASKVGFKFHGLLTWNKNTCTPSRWYMKDLELVLYFYKAPARPINNPGDKQSFACDNPRDKVHPTEKPVPLMQRYVGNSSQPGEWILDPFMGSGSTGIAALNLGREFIGIEMDSAYFDTAKRRITTHRPYANDNQQIDLEEAIAHANAA
jgi:site-specific DNA-methyltransferase (adenine-specific)